MDSWGQVEAAAAFVGLEMEALAEGGGGGGVAAAAAAAEGGECRSLHWKTAGERRRCHEENEYTSCE